MAFAAVRFGIFLVLGHCLAPLIFLLLCARLCLANVEVTARVRLRCGIGETFILIRLCRIGRKNVDANCGTMRGRGGGLGDGGRASVHGEIIMITLPCHVGFTTRGIQM